MKDFITQIFRGDKGEYSHKRLITLIAFLCIVVAFIASTFFGYPVLEFLIDNFMYIVIGGMGIATAEPLANNLLGRDSKKKMKLEVEEPAEPK